MKPVLFLLASIMTTKATQPLPPRTVDTSIYRDFEITLVDKYAINDEKYGHGTSYKVNVKNTGEGYIKNIVFAYNGLSAYDNRLEDKLSDNHVIAPNQEATFIVSASYDVNSLDDLEIYADAYTSFTDELEVTGSKKITWIVYENYHDDLYYNTVDMSLGLTGKDRYCYGAIIKAYADNQEAHFVINEWDNFTFTTYKEIKGNDNDEVEIVKLLKTEYRAYDEEQFQNHFYYKDNKGCNGAIITSISSVAVLGLFVAPIIALRRSKKK